MNRFEKLMPRVISLSRALCKHVFVAIAYIIIKYFFFFFSSNYTYVKEERNFWQIAILILTYLSTSFAFSIYNKQKCLEFLDKESNSLKNDSHEIFTCLWSFDFVIDLAFTGLFFLAFSIEIKSIVAFFSAVLSNFLTYMLARWIWLKDKGNKNPAYLFGAKLAVHLIFSILGLWMLFFFASAFIPSIPTLLVLIELLSYLIFIPIVLAVVMYIRAFAQMHSFLKQFKKFCKDNKIKISEFNKPYLSVFKNNPSETFTLTVNEKTYSCSLISFTNIFVPAVFKADGFYYRISAKNLKQNVKPMLTFEKRYSYESRFPKLIIITSIPYVVRIQEGNRSKTFDTGDMSAGCKIFTLSGIIGAIDRNTIDRKTYD